VPSASRCRKARPSVDAILSDLLDQPVTLTATPAPGAALDRAVPEAVLRDGIDAQVPAELMEIGGGGPPGSFVDFAPLHLLTTSTLDRIAELSPDGRADLERYRPNIVIRTAAPGFTENDWFERILRVGENLVLRVIARTPRCAVPTLAHGPLPRDPDALRVLARPARRDGNLVQLQDEGGAQSLLIFAKTAVDPIGQTGTGGNQPAFHEGRRAGS